jgi:uncharacterized membrane protein
MSLPRDTASDKFRRQRAFSVDRNSVEEGEMPYCSKCGAAVADAAAFCPSCGSPIGAAPAGGPPTSAVPPTTAVQSGLDENLAATFSYALGWVTGLIFFLIDKRPKVQFHARQSIVTFGLLSLIWIVAAPVWGGLSLFGGSWGLAALAFWLLRILGFVLWIVCMIKAYQGVRFRVPIAADISEKIFGKI